MAHSSRHAGSHIERGRYAAQREEPGSRRGGGDHGGGHDGHDGAPAPAPVAALPPPPAAALASSTHARGGFYPGFMLESFQIVRKLGAGSFGDVYEAVDLHNGTHVAVKVEQEDARTPQLLYEGRVLGLFQDKIGFPAMHCCGTWRRWNVLIMELLGKSVEARLRASPTGTLPMPVIFHIAQHALARLHTLHRAGFVHRDVKPENFVFARDDGGHGHGVEASTRRRGHGYSDDCDDEDHDDDDDCDDDDSYRQDEDYEDDDSRGDDSRDEGRDGRGAAAAHKPGLRPRGAESSRAQPRRTRARVCQQSSSGEAMVYIIDFGFTKCLVDPDTGEHIPRREKQRFIGTPRYASLRAHEGVQQSRRDDIEALGYMLVYLARGHLPWQTTGAASLRTKPTPAAAPGPAHAEGSRGRSALPPPPPPPAPAPASHARVTSQRHLAHEYPLDSVAEYGDAPPVPSDACRDRDRGGRGCVTGDGRHAPVAAAGAAGAGDGAVLDARRQSMRHMFGTERAAAAPALPHDAGGGGGGGTSGRHRATGAPAVRARSTLMPATAPLPKAELAMRRTEAMRHQIMQCKRDTPLEELCAGLPPCFHATILHGRTLGFQDMPDYDSLNHWWRSA